MPWRETNPMNERTKLVADWLSGYSVTDLSVMYGISRKCVYKWTNRYQQYGVSGLEELSRAPHCHPNETNDRILECLIATKQSHMNWGPKKLLEFLKVQNPKVQWPSLSTIGKCLKDNGFVKKRRQIHKTPLYSQPFLECDAPNKVWSADYKGQFKTVDGRWCYPLTITDNMSRYILACRGLYSPCYNDTRLWFEWTFREYGLPEAIKTDNGTPFAGRGVAGLSQLSVWFIKLGIRPERIKAGKPQQNGRHERMHRTLKQETIKPPMRDMASQQARFDEFIREFNNDRPHEALEQKTPASVYYPSPRRFPEKLRNPEYDEGVEVRTVRHNGEFKFKNDLYFLSELLVGEKIGLVEMEDGKHEIFFGFHPLGVLNLKLKKVEPKLTKV